MTHRAGYQVAQVLLMKLSRANRVRHLIRELAMTRFVGPLVLFCLSWASTAFALVEETPASPDVEVIRADFGRFDNAPSGAWILTTSASVPLKVGQHYGWSILLKTSKPVVKWREEFTLPSAPATWSDGDSPDPRPTLSSDRKISVLEVEAEPVRDTIDHMWEVAPGDPEGHYVIRVTIDGGNEQVFEFDVHK